MPGVKQESKPKQRHPLNGKSTGHVHHFYSTQTNFKLVDTTMAGINPYIKSALFKSATQKFTITFLPEGKVVEVDPTNIPKSGTGLPGSILDIALASDVDIDHACGGVCACSTCHIFVSQGASSCNESTEDEDDQLEKAPGLSPLSRLSCQCVPDGTQSITVQIPNWNRNLVRE
jgi:2Fe-2S ferredoxin